MSVMELMTQSRSSLAAWARAAALSFADEGVEDAVLEDSGFWTQGGIVDVPDWAGGVVPTWSTRRLRSEAPGGLDEGVEDAVVEGYVTEARDEIIDASGVAEGVVPTRP